MLLRSEFTTFEEEKAKKLEMPRSALESARTEDRLVGSLVPNRGWLARSQRLNTDASVITVAKLQNDGRSQHSVGGHTLNVHSSVIIDTQPQPQRNGRSQNPIARRPLNDSNGMIDTKLQINTRSQQGSIDREKAPQL